MSYWALLANPDIYDIDLAVRTRDVDLWTATSGFRAGDEVAIWRAQGKGKVARGFVALGTVETNPEVLSDPSNPCWRDRGRAITPTLRIRVRYRVPPNFPLLLGNAVADLETLGVAKARGRTVFRLTPEEWRKIAGN